MSEQDDLVTIGKIERPFGVRGEVRVRSLSDVPGRFEHLEQVTLVLPGGEAIPMEVQGSRPIKDGYLLLRFAGLSTPEEAARYRGAWIKIPRHDHPPAQSPGLYYEYELIGMAVVDETGDVLGRLEDVVETPAHHVLVVRGPGGEHLLPATRDVVRGVDRRSQTITVRWTALVTEASDAV